MANSILASVVTLAFGFVFTAVIGGLWAARLQDRSWKKQNDARMREAESERAAAACQDITTLLERVGKVIRRACVTNVTGVASVGLWRRTSVTLPT